MKRLATAFLAVLILPGLVRAQERERPATHEVVRGETLWILAQRYYQNPYLWPRIYEANRGVVEDPHWIYPGENLVIPDVTVTVQDVAVVTPGDPAPEAAPPVREAPPVRPVAPAARPDDRTVFYRRDAGQRFVAADVQSMTPVVAREVFYSARFLVPEGQQPESLGSVGDLVGAEEERRRTYFTYDRVQILTDAPLTPGTALQSYRIAGTIEGVGAVAVPTGVLSVSEDAVGGVVALVVDEFDRLTPGDLVRPLPDYRIAPGVEPRRVATGPAATIVGFGEDRAVQGLYDIAFLDQGGAAGVAVGDEYVLLWTQEEGWPATVEGRLQVVAVEPTHASARIVGLRNPVFEPGLQVVLTRKMP